jgi:hypothetical protein
MRRLRTVETARLVRFMVGGIAVATALAGCGGSPPAAAGANHPAPTSGGGRPPTGTHARPAASQIPKRLEQGAAQVQAIVAECGAQVGSTDRTAVIDCLHRHGLKGSP